MLGLKKLYPDASIHVAVTGVAFKPVDDSYKVDKEVGQIYVSISYQDQLSHAETDLRADTDDQRNSIRSNTVDYIMEKILEMFSAK